MLASDDDDAPVGYVGRRRALDEETLSDLVSARIAQIHGDHPTHHWWWTGAMDRLIAQGYDTAAALLAIERNRTIVEIRAEAEIELGEAWLDSLGETDDPWCPDPDGHDDLERGAAQELRLPPMAGPGCCKWCGLRLPAVQPGGTP